MSKELIERPNSTKDLVERPNFTKDLVNKLRCYADDLHSAGGFNGYASAMSQAADEIVKLRADIAAEREACAKAVETGCYYASAPRVGSDYTPTQMAAAIRARGGE